MRHRDAHRKFSRSPSHRRSMFRNMSTSLLEHGRVETTLHKAKDLRGVVERLITLAGEDTLSRRRRAYSYLFSKPVVHKLFAEIGPRYKDRPGGYTRVVRTRRRAGDAAEMAVIELVTEDFQPRPKRKKKDITPDPVEESKAAAPSESEAPAEEETPIDEEAEASYEDQAGASKNSSEE